MTRRFVAQLSTVALALAAPLFLARAAAAQDDTTTHTTTHEATSSGSDGTTSSTRSETSSSGEGSTTSESNRRTVFVQPAPAPPAEEDDGHKAVLWLEAGLGASYVDAAALSNDNIYPMLNELKGFGPAASLAAHVRIAFFTMGARVSLASYPGFEVGTATVEVGIQPATQFVQPYLRVGFGYGWHGDANYNDPSISSTDTYGYVIEGGFGLELLVSKILSNGAGLDVDLLNMHRQPISCLGTCSATAVSLMSPGDAVGLQVRAQLHAGLRF